MDFERLGESLVSDWLEDNDNYVRASSIDEYQGTTKYDFEKAKSFLSTVNPRLNISLYDHLADVVNTVLRSKIPDAVEKLEELSLEVKKMRQMPEGDLAEVFELSDELQAFMSEKQIFYKIKMPVPEEAAVKEDVDDEEEEADSEDEEEENEEEIPAEDSTELIMEEELDLSEVLPDLHYAMGRFNEAGIGLSTMEVFEMTVALKDLATQFKLKRVRFWGKVFGLKNDYYIAEAPYQEGVVHENYGWKDNLIEKEQVTKDEYEEEKEEQEEDEEEKEEEEEEEKDEDQESNEDEETEESKKKETPPIPKPKEKVKKTVPPEENGTGVNEYLYFVCCKIGHPWRVLPFILPSQISEARYLKRFFTGNLEAEIRGCVPYPGKEAHYLRAQIARITGTTYIAPRGYYRRAGDKDDEDEEEDKEDDEEEDKNQILLNPNFTPKSAKYLFSEGLEGWYHYRKALLEQGRCIPMKLKEGEEDEEDDKEEEPENEEDDDDKKAEEEDPEILEAIVEMEIPILRSLSEDKALGRLKPWSMRLSSRLVEEKAVLIVYSNIWPGAYTFYDGKNFEHIYVGYGFKYSVFHYAPPIRVSWQNEYVVGEDVIEHVDEEILPTVEADDTDNEDGKDKEDGNVKEDEDEEDGDGEEDDDVEEDEPA